MRDRRAGARRGLPAWGLGAALLLATGCTGAGATAAPAPAPAPVSVGTPPARASAPGSPPAPAPAAAASTAGRFGAKWDRVRTETFAPYLREIPGGATWHEVVWCDVEREPGSRDWSDLDAVARSTSALGYTLLLKIRVGSCWATGGEGKHVRGTKTRSESSMPTDMEDYAGFVRETVTRYAALGVHTYAVENEVNAETWWSGSPQDVVALTTVAAAAIRRADPRAVVVDAGISSTAYGVAIADRLLAQGREDEAVAAYSAYYERRFSTRAKLLPPVADVAALRAVLAGTIARRHLGHLAGARRLAESGVVDVRQLHFYESWAVVPALLDYLRATTPKGTAWEAWEVGMYWPDGDADDATRAQELVRTVAQLLAGGVRRVVWLPVAFNPEGREPAEVRHGLLDPAGRARPSGRALRALARAAHGATAAALPSGRLAGVALRTPASTTLVVWAEEEVRLALPAGSTTAAPGDEAGAAPARAVPVGPAPVLVTVPGPASVAAALVAP